MRVFSSLRHTTLALLLAALPWASQAQTATRPLNDTGITWSGNATGGNASTCDASHPAGQDCHYGRDAAAAAGQLVKKGGGSAGFDFTKISNSGAELPASAALGSGANDWACTKDNVTGLVWEVKTTSGLRSQNHRYSWFNTLSPDGNKGTESGGSCAAVGRCDTEKYVADVNAAGLCGASNWRMPTVKELAGIVDRGRTGPAIDLTYFPNTPTSYTWSGSPDARNSNDARLVHFFYGDVSYGNRNNIHLFCVRLVRGGE